MRVLDFQTSCQSFGSDLAISYVFEHRKNTQNRLSPQIEIQKTPRLSHEEERGGRGKGEEEERGGRRKGRKRKGKGRGNGRKRKWEEEEMGGRGKGEEEEKGGGSVKGRRKRKWEEKEKRVGIGNGRKRAPKYEN